MARLPSGGSGRAGDCRPYGRPVGSWRRAAHLLWPQATLPPAAPPPAHTRRPPGPHSLPISSKDKRRHPGPGEPRGAAVGRLRVNRWSMTRRAAPPCTAGRPGHHRHHRPGHTRYATLPTAHLHHHHYHTSLGYTTTHVLLRACTALLPSPSSTCLLSPPPDVWNHLAPTTITPERCGFLPITVPLRESSLF